MTSDIDLKEQKRIKAKEYQRQYEQQEHRKEKSRLESKARCRQKKLLSTASRFSEHDLEELLIIAALRCRENGIDFGANENAIANVMRILHGSQNDQKSLGQQQYTQITT